MSTTSASKTHGRPVKRTAPKAAKDPKAVPRGMRHDPRRGHNRVTATTHKLTFAIDDRPVLHTLTLPGPRRELENRGGATPALDVLRYLIRCPLLPALTKVIAPRGVGRPSAYPDVFWVFVLAATREFGSNDEALQELKSHWTEIAKEFYFEHGIALPKQRGVAYASFNSWRTNAILDRTHQLDILLERFTKISVPLALAIRRAEGGEAPRDLLSPAVWDCVAADGTVRDAPSSIRAGFKPNEKGEQTIDYPGSRAHEDHPERARVHEAVSTMNKPAGASQGLFNVVATTKGVASYTRTVLGVEIGRPREGEAPIAMRLLHRVYGHLGHTLPTLVYDGAMTPVNWQDLMSQYGIFCVNANHARDASKKGTGRGESRRKDFPTDSSTTGEGSYKHGRKRAQKKATYVTQLPQVDCVTRTGHAHVHFITADDGAVYETDQAVLKGGRTAQRIQDLVPVGAERHQDPKGRYFFRLHFKGKCKKGGSHFTFTRDVAWTEPDSEGHVGWRSELANVRIIPDIAEIYPDVNGNRNQIEAFFDWMEQCYLHHDRAASWGRDAQTVDLIATGLLHNAEGWAHLAYRHPDVAAQLANELDALTMPDLSQVTKKPPEERKKALNALLLIPRPVDDCSPDAAASVGPVE